MTRVIKTINGIKYHYYQDAIKVGDKNKTINTCIGRVDLEPEELTKVQEGAFVKHLLAILETCSGIFYPLYHFEAESVKGLEYTMEVLRMIYKQLARNLSPQDLEDFQKTIFVKYVHGTTAIEGNTLTEKETYRLLSSGLTPENKTVNEMLEVNNYLDLKNFLDTYNSDITEKFIKQVHRLLMNNIKDENGRSIKAGEYRSSQVILNKIPFRPPPAEVIPDRIRYLISDYYNSIQENIHPIELASRFHQKFEEIHPFQDGNGRTGRAILNFMLARYGFPQIYLTGKHHSEYLTSLQKGNEENYDPLLHFIMSRINGTMLYLYSKTNLYQHVISGKLEEAAKSFDGKEIFDKWVGTITQYRETTEMP